MKRGTWRNYLLIGLWMLMLVGGVYRCKTISKSEPDPALALEPTCATYAIATDCSTHRLCSWDSSGRCYKSQTCSAYAVDEATCAHYADCRWDVTTRLCQDSSLSGLDSTACSRFATQETCRVNASLGCSWNSSGYGSCQSSASASTDAYCRSFNSTTCPSTCRYYNNICQALATSTNGVNCSIYASSTQCNTYATYCQWVAQSTQIGSSGICQNRTGLTCQSHFTANECNQYASMCRWSGTTCSDLSSSTDDAKCSAVTNQFTCRFFTAGCQWSGSACVVK